MKQRCATPQKNAKQDAFIEAFAKHGNISLACRVATVDRSTVYRWKEHSTTFLARYNQALEEAKDAIRAEIYRRAHDGWDEEVYQLGHYAGTVHKYSDTLLIFHAKALMPEYRDKQQVELSGSIDINGAKETLLSKLSSTIRTIDATHEEYTTE